MKQFSRNLLTFGNEGQEILLNSHVMILGIGGVGSYAVEGLARSGVGKLTLIDKDAVDITNINRQLHATLSTVGQYKCDLMEERILSINPNCKVIKHSMFFNDETYEFILSEKVDFIIDCSDTISYKILLIKECLKRDIPFISVMGAANKLDPSQFKIDDIKNTSYDPIAKVIRTKLKKLGIKGNVPVVYSQERPIVAKFDEIEINTNANHRKVEYPPASNAFVPPVAGFIACSYAIKHLIKSIEIKRIGE